MRVNRHYKRASGALLVYDVTSRSSFENAERVWLRELRNAADSTSSLLDCLVIVGNKVGTFAVTDAGCMQSPSYVAVETLS